MRVWRGNGEGKRGSEAAAGGLDPATSRILTHLRATALHCEACPCIPNPCYMNYEYCEKRVLRVVSITSTKKDGSGGHGGRLRTRDLQQTSPCAPENCLAAPRSAPFFLKSLLYEWLALRGRRAEDTREKNSQNSASLNRRREANNDTTAITTEPDGAEETGSDGASFNMNPCGVADHTLDYA